MHKRAKRKQAKGANGHKRNWTDGGESNGLPRCVRACVLLPSNAGDEAGVDHVLVTSGSVCVESMTNKGCGRIPAVTTLNPG